MLSEAKEIVCLEHESRDPPVFGLVGQRGGGKTLLLHAVTDQIFNKTENPEDPGQAHRIVVYNDRQQQLLSWCKPQSSEGWRRELQSLNHYPTPLPTSFVFPHDYDLGSIDVDYGASNIIKEEEGVSFRITLPYKGIIDNYKYFFEGRKNWDLGGSERYFKQLRGYLRECTTLPQIKEILNKYLGGTEGQNERPASKGLKGTISKIYAVMEDLFETQLLDVNTPYPSKWKVFFKGKEFTAKWYKKNIIWIWLFILAYKFQDEWFTHVSNVDRTDFFKGLF